MCAGVLVGSIEVKCNDSMELIFNLLPASKHTQDISLVVIVLFTLIKHEMRKLF